MIKAQTYKTKADNTGKQSGCGLRSNMNEEEKNSKLVLFFVKYWSDRCEKNYCMNEWTSIGPDIRCGGRLMDGNTICSLVWDTFWAMNIFNLDF